MRFYLPEASTSASQIDYLILGLTVVAFAIIGLVFFLIIFYMIRYRYNSPIDRGKIAQRTFKFEMSWTTATLLIFFGLFIWGSIIYVGLY